MTKKAPPLPQAAFEAIRHTVGEKGWIDDETGLEPYLAEQRGRFRGTCLCAVRPASAQEVAAVVGICAGAGIPIVPQGGNTGLVGGAVPQGGLVLSTERLTAIGEIDPLNRTITLEAGVILADVQEAADRAGLLFPLSLGAEGSCRIGGNISTNAGGVGVLRYGTARDLVLGLEVVLPDGRIWNGLRGLRKDNTGYDLKHLFIGAEGTLGIITAAVLKLFPKPKQKETALVALGGLARAQSFFALAQDAFGDVLSAFEMMGRTGLDFGLRHVPGLKDPFEAPHPCYILLELGGGGDARLKESLEKVLAEAFGKAVIEDAVIAASTAQAENLWRLREAIPEAQKHEGGSIKHDVSIPIGRIADFISQGTALAERELPGVRVCAFGHFGDGNIHFNLSQPEDMEKQAFLDMWEKFNRMIHDLAVGMGGSFSAEHGVGLLKRGDMALYKQGVELDLMRSLKSAIDPQGIMNPGKVL